MARSIERGMDGPGLVDANIGRASTRARAYTHEWILMIGSIRFLLTCGRAYGMMGPYREREYAKR